MQRRGGISKGAPGDAFADWSTLSKRQTDGHQRKSAERCGDSK
jgi:hypothetical protein